MVELVQQMLIISLYFSYFYYKQNKRMVINECNKFKLTVFVMLMSPKLIVHHYVFHLRILMIGSYTQHFLCLYIFSHLDQLFLVNVIWAIKRKNKGLVMILVKLKKWKKIVKHLRESIQRLMNILVNKSMIYFESCSNMCIILLDNARLQSYCVGIGCQFTHGAHNWLMSKIIVMNTFLIGLMTRW